jgi:opacity protein-like surface antigen
MKTWTGVLTILFLFAGTALAQEEMPSQVAIQFTGLIPRDATGNGITDHATKSGGFQLSYTHLLHKWAAAEASYGYGRNTQNYSGDFGTAGVQANINKFTGAFVLRLPVHVSRLRPYALAGGGVLRFSPTSDPGNAAGAVSQSKGTFLYGAGADVDLSRHVGLRVDYRGFLFKPPDFTLSGFTVGTTTHLAQPSIGIFFRL